MNESVTIDVGLPKSKIKNIETINKRFIRMGFRRLDSIKRETLPVIQNTSILKRFKTDRSQQKYQYVNQFQEFTHNQCTQSNSSMKYNRQIQPLSMYKKPKIKDNFIFYRKKFLPKVKSFKKSEELQLKENIEKNEFESENSLKTSNQSIFFYNQNQLLTFYPSKLQQKQ